MTYLELCQEDLWWVRVRVRGVRVRGVRVRGTAIIQPMSEANVGANFMVALRTKTKNAPITKKQCIFCFSDPLTIHTNKGGIHQYFF